MQYISQDPTAEIRKTIAHTVLIRKYAVYTNKSYNWFYCSMLPARPMCIEHYIQVKSYKHA